MCVTDCVCADHDNEDLTPEDLERAMNAAKVSHKQQAIFTSWFWAHQAMEHTHTYTHTHTRTHTRTHN